MTNMNELKVEALNVIIHQYDFINILEQCGDAKDNPQYFKAQINQLVGMREMFEAIFNDAPHTEAAAHAMLIKASYDCCPF